MSFGILGPISSDGGDDNRTLYIDFSEILHTGETITSIIIREKDSSVLTISDAQVNTAEVVYGGQTATANQSISFNVTPASGVEGYYKLDAKYATSRTPEQQTEYGQVQVKRAI